MSMMGFEPEHYRTCNLISTNVAERQVSLARQLHAEGKAECV